MESGPRKFDSQALLDWARDSVGIPTDLIISLDRDDDWAFVIKMHGIVEAGLNHLILNALGRKELQAVIPLLATADRRTGKLAFIKACDLLPEIARKFVSMFAKMRDDLVHDIKNFDFSLEKYFADLDKQQTKNWKTALMCWCVLKRDGKLVVEEGLEDLLGPVAIKNPRTGIYNACMGLLIFSVATQRQAEMNHNLLKVAKELHDKGMKIMSEKNLTSEDVEKMMAEIETDASSTNPKES
jgi:hypothetical protein